MQLLSDLHFSVANCGAGSFAHCRSVELLALTRARQRQALRLQSRRTMENRELARLSLRTRRWRTLRHPAVTASSTGAESPSRMPKRQASRLRSPCKRALLYFNVHHKSYSRPTFAGSVAFRASSFCLARRARPRVCRAASCRVQRRSPLDLAVLQVQLRRNQRKPFSFTFPCSLSISCRCSKQLAFSHRLRGSHGFHANTG